MTAKDAWKLRVRLNNIMGCLRSWHIKDAREKVQSLMDDLEPIAKQGKITDEHAESKTGYG